MRRRSRKAGFTVIEMILVIMLIGILAASTAILVLQGTKSYADLVNRTESLHHARLTMERISREVRTASAVGLSSCQLNITKPNGDLINVFKDGTTNARIKRNGQPAAGTILAEGISALCFNIETGSTPNWVQISLTQAGGQKYRTKVYLRREIFYP